MHASAPAKYFDGMSPNAVAGVLTATPEGVVFEPDSQGDATVAPGPAARGATAHFAYDQISETKAAANEFRVQIFIDAGESRELRFSDRALFERIQQGRRENARGLRGVVQYFAAWSTPRKILIGALLLPLSVGVFLFGIEGAHVLVPESADRRLGDHAVAYLENGMEFCEDPQLGAAVNEMLVRLAGEDAPERYNVRIVREDEVNALALPNGNIYLFSGLLAESESAAEVAGVLAHEIGHIEERHSMRQLIQALGVAYLTTMILGSGFEEVEAAETIAELASVAVFFKYSRDFEREADLYGLRLLEAAGIEARGLVDFFARRVSAAGATDSPADQDVAQTKPPEDAQETDSDSLEAALENSLENLEQAIPDFLSTHPADEERVRYLEAAIAGGPAGSRSLALERERWQSLRARCSDISKSAADL